MENNAADSGGRVTRSLRKRLASVDSDNPSRPGTPVSSKLISISEIPPSPSRATRMTRRNSTSGVATPIKTPSKRNVGASVIANLEKITPKKSYTTRSSISTNENEESCQTLVQILAVLDEENTQSDLKPNRVTRSQSNSPQLSNSLSTSSSKNNKSPIETKNKEMVHQKMENLKKRKPGPKSKTRVNEELNEDVSDVEISVFEKEFERIKTTTPSTSIIVLTDDDSSSAANNDKEEEQNLEKNRLESLNELQIEKKEYENNVENKQNLEKDVLEITHPVNVSKEETLNNKLQIEKNKHDIKEENKQVLNKDDMELSHQLEFSEKETLNFNDFQIEKIKEVKQNLIKDDLQHPLNFSEEETNTNEVQIDNYKYDDKDEENKNLIKYDVELRDPLNISEEPIININELQIEKNNTDINKEGKQNLRKDDLIELSHPLNFSEEETLNVNDQQTEKNKHDIIEENKQGSELSHSLKFSEEEMLNINDLQNTEEEIQNLKKDDLALSHPLNYSEQDLEKNDMKLCYSLNMSEEPILNINELQKDKSNHAISKEGNQQNLNKIDLDHSCLLKNDEEETLNIKEQNKQHLQKDDLDTSRPFDLAEEDPLNDNVLQIEKNKHNNREQNKQNVKKCGYEVSHPLNLSEEEIVDINEMQIKNNDSEPDTEESNHKESGEEKNLHIPNDDIENEIINVQCSAEMENEQKSYEINLSNSKGLDNDISHANLKDSTTPEAKEKSFQSDKIETESGDTSKDFTTLEVKGKPMLPEKTEILSVSTVNFFDSKEALKKVDFVSSPSNDMTAKHVYPKTPASTKTTNNFKQFRSTYDDSSFQDESKSLVILNSDNDENAMTRSEQHIDDTKVTPARVLKCFHTMESSTPINIESFKQKEYLLQIKEKNTGKVKGKFLDEDTEKACKPEKPTNITLDEDNDHSSNQNKDELKWINPSIKGRTSDGSKLDVVITQYNRNANNCCDNVDNISKQMEKNNQNITFSSEDEEQGDEDNDKEGEESYIQKHDFLDDEAMEVNDYESGASMDSEERREIEENEIPFDAESLGNQTTDDDQGDEVEEEGSESTDSFIVSDTEELKIHESDIEGGDIDENTNEGNRKKIKTSYKRIQRITDSSSASEEEVKNVEDIDDDISNKDKNLESTKENETKSIEKKYLLDKRRESILLDSSKLSESALRLHYEDKSESEEENYAEATNISCKEILHSINQSDRFNKSIRNLNTEIHSSPIENSENFETIGDKNNYEDHTVSTSPDMNANKTPNIKIKRSESHLGEVSVASESDGDKENDVLYVLEDRKNVTGLSISLGNYTNPKGRQERQRSFTIDVTVKHEELETDAKLNETTSTASSSNGNQENERESENLKYLENSRHMAISLGNPLIRTRRQSLALPTNPDMEICSSSSVDGLGKTGNRKSLGILSSIDFKPSQSFIDCIELQKSERNQLVSKRKRLSKSFCGASDSIIDIDDRHFHKRSKLMNENSTEECQDSTESINSSNHFTKISSTPHDKINKNYAYNSERILTRCDEILEAANSAKLEAKIRNRKSKSKISKKQSKKKSAIVSSEETTPADTLRGISKQINHKTKTALSQAIMAADVILRKRKKPHQHKEEQEKPEPKQLTPDAMGKSTHIKKKNKKELVHKQEQNKEVHTASTPAGNFMELPQTPQKKKKKSTYIQLATGKVCVEPSSPKRRLVKAFNGMEFIESPVVLNAVGFKVSKISTLENSVPSSSLRTRKRKRYDESFKDFTIPKAHWTQSGIFTEEEISKTHGNDSQKAKKRQEERKEHNVNHNFKEKAIMRPEIRRGTKREMLLLKERRQNTKY